MNVVHTYNGILFRNKKESITDRWYNMNEPPKTVQSERSQIQKVTYCMISLCKICTIGKPIEAESRLLFLGGWGEGEMSDCLMGTRFPFGWWKCFGVIEVVMAKHCEFAKCH